MAASTPRSPLQQALPMDLPVQAPEALMRALFERKWSRWHRARTYEEAVADPTTRRLLELAVIHGERHSLGARGRRR